MIRTYQDAVTRYGTIVNGVWLSAAGWCDNIDVPEPIYSHLTNAATGKACKKIYCNKDMVIPLQHVFNDIIASGLCEELKTFDGCFNVRDVRGRPGYPSAHSYALAIDLNAKMNPLGKWTHMNVDVVSIFEDHGFTWGGRFLRIDGMHFSYAWE